MWRLLNLRSLAFAAVFTALLVVAFVVGSRNLENAIFKMIPLVAANEANAMIGIVSCVGAF